MSSPRETPHIFIEKSRVGRAIFEIRGGELRVTSWSGSKRSEAAFPLRGLSSNYVVTGYRHYPALLVATAGVVISSVALWLLWQWQDLPEGLGGYLSHWPWMGLAASLIIAIRFTPRIELIVFADHWGRAAAWISREINQAPECDAFIRALVAQIELAQSDHSEETKAEIARSIAAEFLTDPITSHRLRYWQISLATGFIALVLPLLPGANELLDAMMFLVVFPMLVSGLVFACLSLSSKEPGRRWGFLGLLIGVASIWLHNA